MWSIRMRASKSILVEGLKDKESQEIHVSGAEGLYKEDEISLVLEKYLNRALKHSRGKPDKIFFTIEKIGESIIKVPPLLIKTLVCNSPEEAMELITNTLSSLGVSQRAIQAGFRILLSTTTMRGAALIRSNSGSLNVPDPHRGIRVSRLGIDNDTKSKIELEQSQTNINTTRGIEALTLASKVAYHKDIIAEVCISDDPDYTTGYLASKDLGYLRILNIKRLGEMHGGRVFFIKEESDLEGLINYLEKTPVKISF